MSDFRIESRIRRLTIAVLCGCVVLVLGTVAALASPRLRQVFGFGADSPGYERGERIDVPGEAYGAASYTLVVFARSSCAVCQAIRPVLAEAIGEFHRSEDVRVSVIMTAGSPAEGREYVRELGLTESSFFLQTPRDLKVRVVPTAVLVDRHGTILEVSEGGGQPFRDFMRLVLLRITTS